MSPHTEFTDQNPPAFPRSYNAPDGHNGMSLRDWFAGQADVTDWKINDLDVAAAFVGLPTPTMEDADEAFRLGAAVQAKLKYMLADAMLALRAKEQAK